MQRFKTRISAAIIDPLPMLFYANRCESWNVHKRVTAILTLLLLAACADARKKTPEPPSAASPKPSPTGLCRVLAYPEMPLWNAESGTTERVVVEATLTHGLVNDVKVLTGPTMFKDAIVEAMGKYRCVDTEADQVFKQEFVFKMN